MLLALRIKGLEHLETEVKLSPPRGRPLKNSMKNVREFAKGGGAKRIVRFFGGGGSTIKCFKTRPQNVGFVWSVPVSSKENGRREQGGGRNGRSKTVFGEGLYGMFSPPLISPPLFFSETSCGQHNQDPKNLLMLFIRV